MPPAPKKGGATVAGKDAALAQRLAGLVGTATGASSVRIGHKGASDVTEAIPFGCAELDEYVTGCGGLPLGRMTEIFSGEGGGKTALMLSAAGNCQKAGGLVVLADTEETITTERCQAFGVDPERVMWLETGSLEKTLLSMETVVRGMAAKDGPVLLGWDSLAQTPSTAEIKAGVVAGSKELASERSKTMARAIRVLAGMVSGKRVAFTVINQLRITFGASYGVPDNTPGGAAMRFYATLRLTILGGSDIKGAAGTPVGKDLTVYGVKNKLAPSHRKARSRLMYYEGFDPTFGAIECADALGMTIPPHNPRDATYEVAGQAATAWLREQRLAGWPTLRGVVPTVLVDDDGVVLEPDSEAPDAA